VDADALVPLFKLVTGKLPVTPVVSGNPVAFVSVTEVGVPRIGVTKVGLVAKTFAPVPVEVVTPEPPLATGKVLVTPVVNDNNPEESMLSAINDRFLDMVMLLPQSKML
jgi:hypothetical protein